MMGSTSSGKMIVGLDIGTSKVVAIVGEVAGDGGLKIVGLGSHQSRGLKKGVVVNIESTVQSIQRAVEEAELMAGCQIHSVYAGIAGSHIRSLNSHGIVAIRDREVYAHDVERVIDAAQAVAIPADQKILHILPQESTRLSGAVRLGAVTSCSISIVADTLVELPQSSTAVHVTVISLPTQ